MVEAFLFRKRIKRETDYGKVVGIEKMNDGKKRFLESENILRDF
jgi:hypothetical protein